MTLHEIPSREPRERYVSRKDWRTLEREAGRTELPSGPRNRWQQIVVDFDSGVAARTGTSRLTGPPFPRVVPRPSPTRFAANLLPDGAENDETEQDELGNPGRVGR